MFPCDLARLKHTFDVGHGDNVSQATRMISWLVNSLLAVPVSLLVSSERRAEDGHLHTCVDFFLPEMSCMEGSDGAFTFPEGAGYL